MKKRIALLLTATLLAASLAGCNTGKTDETETDSMGGTTVAETTSEETETESKADETSGETTSTSETESETETETEIVPEGVLLDHKRLENSLESPNLLTGSRFEDAEMGYVLKLTSNSGGDDPNITLNFRNYCKAYGADPFAAENYRYILLRVKTEKCSQSTFDLFYAAGRNSGITGECSVQSSFDNSGDGWQYIVFDMEKAAGWEGDITLLRFDYQPRVISAGETMYISAIWFAKDEVEMLAITRRGLEDPFVIERNPEAESKVEELLSTADKAPANGNQKLTAENEDASLEIWFNHAHTKTPAEDVTSTGLYSYTLRMAKNEAEGVHLLLASKQGHSGIKVSVTGFKNASGDELKTELLYGYYFEDVDGKTVVDPTPWVKEGQTFDLDGGRSYMYIIKATSMADSPAGEYTATVTITDKDGKEIKKAAIKAYVWDFALPEETSCKTQMDLSWWNIYVAHECYEGDDSLLYKNYYDLLLENRICAYTLPYATKGTFTDPRVNEYLNNPRVTAFNPIDWKNHEYTDDTIQAAYAYLSQNEAWLEKSYFYIVDEPGNKEALDKIIAAAEQLEKYFPGYKMMAPMHLNYALNADCTEDFISYIDKAINVWCYKPYFYTTYAEYNYDKNLTYRMSAGIEKNLGTFGERMEKEQAEGDELWWYVTRRPESPEITLGMDTESVRHRILFWQQKLYNVDSFLYYLVNDWYEIGENNGLNKKHESATGVDNFDCYGNGVLVYCGQDFDVYGGVGSLRLENVRDGIEDFEYLTMLEELYGKEVTDALIYRLTTDISHYNTDTDNFNALRIALGNILEDAMKNK